MVIGFQLVSCSWNLRPFPSQVRYGRNHRGSGPHPASKRHRSAECMDLTSITQRECDHDALEYKMQAFVTDVNGLRTQYLTEAEHGAADHGVETHPRQAAAADG